MQRLKKRLFNGNELHIYFFYCLSSDAAIIVAKLFFRVLGFVIVFILIQVNRNVTKKFHFLAPC